jgi:hypothetical protein
MDTQNPPYIRFKFVVHIGDEAEGNLVGGFDEVSGLSVDSDGNLQSTRGPIRISLQGEVICKDWLQGWREAIEKGQACRCRLNVSWRDKEGRVRRRWGIQRAWPRKIEGPAFERAGNEIAVEAMELMGEGITIGESDRDH